jgi:hypothetical protein
MKRFLLSTVISVVCLVSTARGYYPETTYYYSEETTYYYPDQQRENRSTASNHYYVNSNDDESTGWGEILGAAAIVAGVAGLTYCALKQGPYTALDKARDNYNAINPKLLRFLDEYATTDCDVAELAALFYVKSAYPLVTVAKRLNVAHDETKNALKKVREARGMLSKDSFVRDCNRLQEKLHDRLKLVDEVLAVVHSHPLWPGQYALSLQEVHYQKRQYDRENHRDDSDRWQYQMTVTERWD